MTQSATRIRVCIIAPSMGILGGQAVAAKNLLERLRSEVGLEMGFLPINPVLPAPLHLLQRIKYVRTLVTSIAYVVSLVLRIPRYDVLHVFAASYWSFLLAPTPAILIGKFFCKRVILNYHSGEAEDHLTRWGTTAIPVIRKADALVVPSGYLVSVFRRFGLQAKAIANFVDMERIPYRPRTRIAPLLLSNRNLEPLYNVAGIVDAFGRIQRQFRNAALIVAGDGSEREKLEHRVTQLRLANVTFLGALPPNEMERLYDKADVYVNASLIDNMPLSIMEAFAAGTPVVSSDAGGIPFLVDDGLTGILVPAGDNVALAEAVIGLLADPSRALSLSTAAYEHCRSSLVWPVVAEQWRRVYHGDPS